MHATITVKMDNAAFEEPATEMARILRKLAEEVECGADYVPLRDLNGNKVGEFNIGDH
jgi:hypothetical protein